MFIPSSLQFDQVDLTDDPGMKLGTCQR
jgi:hypothetical protein